METVTGEVRPRSVWWGPLALAAAALCWGLSVPLSKRAIESLPPVTLLTLQLLVSVGLLWPAAVLRRKRRETAAFTHGGFWCACFSGALQPGLTYLLVVLGLLFTSASKVVLLDATEPILIMALAAALLGERLSRLQILLAAVTLLGTALVILPQIDLAALSGQGGIGNQGMTGDALVLGSVAVASLYVVLSRRLIMGNDSLVLVAVQQGAALGIAVIALLVALAFKLSPLGLDGLTPEIGLIVIVSGLLQFALPFWLYLIALRHVSASVSSLYLPLIPVSGLVTAHLLLGERLAAGQWAGAVLIILSVLGVSWLTLRQR